MKVYAHGFSCLERPEGSNGCSGTGVISTVSPKYGCWNMKSGMPLKKKKKTVILTARGASTGV